MIIKKQSNSFGNPDYQLNPLRTNNNKIDVVKIRA